MNMAHIQRTGEEASGGSALGRPVEYSAEDIHKAQRTRRGKAFEALMTGVKVIRESPRAEHKEMWAQLKGELTELLEDGQKANAPHLRKAVTPASVHQPTFMSNLSVQYQNDEYIGERLLTPVTVSKRSDYYAIYPKRERLAYPDDQLTSRAIPQEISESRSSDNYSVRDYGFTNFVSADTIDNEDAVFDEMSDLTMALNEAMSFKREVRLATILTTAANFAGNTVTLAGTDQWDSATGGNPVQDIQRAKAAIWNGRGMTRLVGYCSLDVFNALVRNPTLLDLLKYTQPGLATKVALANIFGLDDILVGAARKDTANSGQTASYSRIWGNHFGIVRVMNAPSRRTAAFGAIFRLNGDPVTTQWFDQAIGKKGGYYAKVGVSEDAKIIAGDTGYLIVNATS